MSAATRTPRLRGIPFSDRLVRAILNTQPDVWPAAAIDPARPFKWQTRRIAKPPRKAVFLPQDHWKIDPDEPGTAYLDDFGGRLIIKAPYGIPGDYLYVREAYSPDHAAFYPHYPLVYRADGYPAAWEIANGKVHSQEVDESFPFRWRPARYMPRRAARLFLRIERVRLERLREISYEDTIAEGVEWNHGPFRAGHTSPQSAFFATWRELHCPKGFTPENSNPWVWVYDFARVSELPKEVAS